MRVNIIFKINYNVLCGTFIQQFIESNIANHFKTMLYKLFLHSLNPFDMNQKLAKLNIIKSYRKMRLT